MNSFSFLISKIKTEQQRISDALVEGQAVNFETYQRLVGQHQGLALALDVLNQMLEEDANREL